MDNKEKGPALSESKGFTLLELLIVITIISVLSVALIVVINPAETLRKARDTQRLSDLASLKTALGIYITNKTSPLLDNVDNSACQATTGTFQANDKIWYSVDSTTATISGNLHGGTGNNPADSQVVTAAELGEIDGTGWLPVNLAGLTGGSPISNMPIDPVNDAAAGASELNAMRNSGLVYRYACAADNLTFELNARLESVAFLTDDDRDGKDGGNNTELYEIGSSLTILGSGDTF